MFDLFKRKYNSVEEDIFSDEFYCDECRDYGNDYYEDIDGELISSCIYCPYDKNTYEDDDDYYDDDEDFDDDYDEDFDEDFSGDDFEDDFEYKNKSINKKKLYT